MILYLKEFLNENYNFSKKIFDDILDSAYHDLDLDIYYLYFYLDKNPKLKYKQIIIDNLEDFIINLNVNHNILYSILKFILKDKNLILNKLYSNDTTVLHIAAYYDYQLFKLLVVDERIDLTQTNKLHETAFDILGEDLEVLETFKQEMPDIYEKYLREKNAKNFNI